MTASVQSRVAVERAIAEWRAGRPVLLRDGPAAALAGTVETLDEARLAAFAAAGSAHLVLPPQRLKRLGITRLEAGTVPLAPPSLAQVEQLALSLDARYDGPVASALPLDCAALELARLSQTLPAAVLAPVTASAPADVVAVEREALMAYRAAEAANLAIVARAPVPLEGGMSEFVVFRGGEGLRDQVAIIIGTPDLTQSVPVRLHSACLTGDLFGSLKCDCGDQLRGTASWMAGHGGGVILYLDQEGRGNGISSKMRAYALQAKGFDTYEADEALGFGQDQRRFDFAARMLQMLGLSHVEIMTNNPFKIAALKAAGLDVTAERRVIGRPNRHNVGYLATKQAKAGHAIDAKALMDQLKAGE